MSRRDAVELVWPGKYGADGARAELPTRAAPLAVEVRAGAPGAEGRDLLICADNLLAMDALLATHAGKVDLVYIDPPFATGQAFERTAQVGEGEALRAHAYCDRWTGGLAGFLRMLDPRLRRIYRLLAPRGSLYVHVDPTVGHAVKLLLDEVFGPECFQREIVWRIGWVSGFKTRAHNWIRNHDLIFFYTKDPQRFTFHKQVVPHPPGYKRRRGEPAKGAGVPVDDVWNAGPAELQLRGAASLDSIQIKSFSREKTGWATQKNESLLRRIVAASSNPGDLVADFFCGAGTTLAVAQALGRRFIGCDSAAAAVELAHARLLEQPGARFDRCGLGAREREIWLEDQALGWPAAALRMRQAEPAEAPLSGRAGEVGVLVGPLAQPVTAAAVRAAAGAAAAAGLSRLEVLGWAWAFPAGEELSAGTGVDVACLQLRRALLDERLQGRAELLWSERPAIEVAFAAEPGPEGPRLRAGLTALRFAHPERLAEALREAAPQWHDLVDAWAVEFAAGAGPFTPDASASRTRTRRELPLATPWVPARGPGPWTARVRVVDAAGGESWHGFRLELDEAGALRASPCACPGEQVS